MFLALAVTSQALWSKSSSSIRLKAANTPAHSELPQPPILTHTWLRDNKTGRRRKDASRRWGITYVFKDGSSLTAWILQAAQINRSLQTLPPSLYSFSLLISQHLASVYFLDDLSLPFCCFFFLPVSSTSPLFIWFISRSCHFSLSHSFLWEEGRDELHGCLQAVPPGSGGEKRSVSLSVFSHVIYK